ncbi:hypothetical protein RND71_040827 [Anisodus tanguticus]|uniref:50S ribosomal protein L29 n=1 Tax=Anisodus tanguticus TaxID=243964 RepID=A0AAE1QTE8_9SOLA|nr:hypothetical protein RND71_040827 [Anisodus tanguticus]
MSQRPRVKRLQSKELRHLLEKSKLALRHSSSNRGNIVSSKKKIAHVLRYVPKVKKER